jgi:membrane protease YdiL (CAAX protease family)
VGSTLIFALAHGINIVFPAAVVAGLATAEIYRCSGSVWTAVVVHVVFNLPTIPVIEAILQAFSRLIVVLLFAEIIVITWQVNSEH